MRYRAYVKEMRVHHYIKNLLVFVPLACSGELLSGNKLGVGLLGFLAFCLISSAVYCINDIRDVDKDRSNPEKCNRPIAKGEISIKNGTVLAAVLILLSLVLNMFCFHIGSSVLLIVYFLINIGYSFGLKNIPLLDVGILAAGFLIRASYGAIITDIAISKWLYLVVISISFYMGFGKRRNELIQNEKLEIETRKVLKKYSLSYLDRSMYLFMGLTFVFYALWTVDDMTVSAYNSDNLIWTVPIVMVALLKYSMDIDKGDSGDPVEVLLHDSVLLMLCILYLLTMFALLYVLK